MVRKRTSYCRIYILCINVHCNYIYLYNRDSFSHAQTRTNLLSWIKPLLFKAETLDLIKVETSFEWDHIVCGYSSDRPICWIPGCVECQRSFAWHQFDLPLVGPELPLHRCTSVCIESRGI